LICKDTKNYLLIGTDDDVRASGICQGVSVIFMDRPPVTFACEELYIKINVITNINTFFMLFGVLNIIHIL